MSATAYGSSIWACYTVKNFSKPGSILHFVVHDMGVYVCNHNSEINGKNVFDNAILWINRNKLTGLLPEHIVYIANKRIFEDKETKENVGRSFEKSTINLSKLGLKELVRDKGNELHDDIHTLKQLLEA